MRLLLRFTVFVCTALMLHAAPEAGDEAIPKNIVALVIRRESPEGSGVLYIMNLSGVELYYHDVMVVRHFKNKPEGSPSHHMESTWFEHGITVPPDGVSRGLQLEGELPSPVNGRISVDLGIRKGCLKFNAVILDLPSDAPTFKSLAEILNRPSNNAAPVPTAVPTSVPPTPTP